MFQVIIVYPGSTVYLSFQLQTLDEALSVSQSIGLLVRLSIRMEKWKNKGSRCLCVEVEVGVWIGVGCPCPPVATLVFSLSIYDFFPTAISRLYW